MKSSDFDFKNIDMQQPGSWPGPVKYVFAALIIIIICLAAWFAVIKTAMEDLAKLEQTEQTLLTEFEGKQARVANLEEYRKQLDDMREILRQMLRQLPSRTEMPDLLDDVSQAALSTGIDNQKFQPQPEVLHEFYAEKPISLRMVGTYHQFGEFVSAVASLPRVVILTMHDIQLRPQQDTRAAPNAAVTTAVGALVLEGTVKTYRYVDDEESAKATGEATGTPAAPAAEAPQ